MLFFLILIFSSLVCAEPASMMLSPSEENALEKVLSDSPNLQTSKTQQSDEDLMLYLSSIIFVNEDKWTLWINDQRVSDHKNIPNNISITTVTSSHILFNLQNDPSRQFQLDSNQTYMVQEQKIVDGDARKSQPSHDTPAVL